MAKIEKSELLKLAELSSLKLYDNEIDQLKKDLEELLEYTDQLSQVTLGREVNTPRSINVFRDDVAYKKEHQTMLSQAPEKAGNHFVVPKVVDSGN